MIKIFQPQDDGLLPKLTTRKRQDLAVVIFDLGGSIIAWSLLVIVIVGLWAPDSTLCYVYILICLLSFFAVVS